MLRFELSREESQKVLNALVKEPYIEVVDIINKIQQQANEQIQESQSKQEQTAR